MNTFANDLFAVLKPLRLLLAFHAFAFFAFNGVDQGHDMMVGFLENTHIRPSTPFLFLLFASVVFSIVSEFCARIILYLSNLSEIPLSTISIKRRKYLQRKIPTLFLFLPLISLFTGLIKAAIHTHSFHSFIPLIPLFIFCGMIIYLIYFSKYRSYWFVLPLSRKAISQLANLSSAYQLSSTSTPTSISPLKPLLKRFYLFLFIALFFILFFAFLSNEYFSFFGATGLIALSFACWMMVYTFIESIAIVQPFYFRKKQLFIPLKSILIIWLLLCSYFNPNHPLKLLATSTKNISYIPDSSIHKVKNLTPIFIATEGGALRTGAYSALWLASLDSIYPNAFSRVKALSGVSGGALGNGIAVSAIPYLHYQKNNASIAFLKSFFKGDFLSAATGKLVFGEVIGWFLPFYIPYFDRQIALQESWEQHWDLKTYEFQFPELQHALAKSFPFASPQYPALLFQSTISETGEKCLYSNHPSLPINYKTRQLSPSQYPLSASGAIGTSTRFPIISPGAKIPRLPFHIVDGGYYENSGTESLLEYLKSQPPIKNSVIILLSFDVKSENNSPFIQWFNEWTEPLFALLNSRKGRTEASKNELISWAQQHHIQIIQMGINPSTKDVPMNWLLSDRAIQLIQSDIHQQFVQNKKMYDGLFLTP